MRRVDGTETHPFLARHIAKSEVLRSGWTLGKLVFLTTEGLPRTDGVRQQPQELVTRTTNRVHLG